MKFFVRVLPYAALVVLAGCETVQTTDAGAVGVTREQRVTTMVSSQEIEQQAAKEYAQLMSEAQKKGLLNRDPQQVARVRTITQRLVPQVAVFRRTRCNGNGRAMYLHRRTSTRGACRAARWRCTRG